MPRMGSRPSAHEQLAGHSQCCWRLLQLGPSSCSLRGSHVLVCMLAWHWKDRLCEELSGACQLSTPPHLPPWQSLGCQDWIWDLGESREGGSVCKFGDQIIRQQS